MNPGLKHGHPDPAILQLAVLTVHFDVGRSVAPSASAPEATKLLLLRWAAEDCAKLFVDATAVIPPVKQ